MIKDSGTRDYEGGKPKKSPQKQNTPNQPKKTHPEQALVYRHSLSERLELLLKTLAQLSLPLFSPPWEEAQEET